MRRKWFPAVIASMAVLVSYLTLPMDQMSNASTKMTIVSKGVSSGMTVNVTVNSGIPISSVSSGTPSGSASLASTDSDNTKKWGLWSQGTRLRGANVYQQDETRNDTGGDGDFGPHLVKADLMALARAGANYVNFSVPGTFHVKSGKEWPEMTRHLDEMISWAKEARLFAVISLRTGPGRGEGDITEDGLMDKSVFTNAKQQDAWVAMWKQIATRYQSEEHVVGFDLMVEPHDVERAEWRNFAQKMIAGIRSVDSATPILVSPGDWGGVDSLEDWEPLTGDMILYTVHQYEPFDYTHEEAASYSAQRLPALYSEMKQWLTEHPGEHLVVNEFGVKKHKRRAEQFLKQQLRLLEQLGVNHAAWLWEVSDAQAPSYAPQFDFKKVPAQMAVFRDNWKRNAIHP